MIPISYQTQQKRYPILTKTAVFLWKGLLILSVAAAAGLFLSNLIYHVTISYDNERITIHTALGESVLILPLMIILFCAAVFHKKHLVAIKEDKLFLVFTAAYTVAAACFILNIDPVLRADASQVSESAKSLLNGNFGEFQSGYLNAFPHQLGLVLYDAVLYLFSQNAVIHFIMNYLFVLETKQF